MDAPKETYYAVTVSHPTGFHNGTHTIRVRMCFGGKFRFCGGSNFGCSRDYLVKNDKEAITKFLAEHACTVVKIKKVKS